MHLLKYDDVFFSLTLNARKGFKALIYWIIVRALLYSRLNQALIFPRKDNKQLQTIDKYSSITTMKTKKITTEIIVTITVIIAELIIIINFI